MIEPTSPGPRVILVLTSPGPRVILVLTSPGPHVILVLQASSSESTSLGMVGGHPHIANMIDELGDLDAPHMHAVLEYCDGGTLKRYLDSLAKNNPTGTLQGERQRQRHAPGSCVSASVGASASASASVRIGHQEQPNGQRDVHPSPLTPHSSLLAAHPPHPHPRARSATLQGCQIRWHPRGLGSSRAR